MSGRKAQEHFEVPNSDDILDFLNLKTNDLIWCIDDLSHKPKQRSSIDIINEIYSAASKCHRRIYQQSNEGEDFDYSDFTQRLPMKKCIAFELLIPYESLKKQKFAIEFRFGSNEEGQLYFGPILNEFRAHGTIASMQQVPESVSLKKYKRGYFYSLKYIMQYINSSMY